MFSVHIDTSSVQPLFDASSLVFPFSLLPRKINQSDIIHRGRSNHSRLCLSHHQKYIHQNREIIHPKAHVLLEFDHNRFEASTKKQNSFEQEEKEDKLIDLEKKMMKFSE